MSSIPDLFVIGAMKGGTSTFWMAAFDDKALCPSKSKEVNYMLRDRTAQELEELYSRQFSHRDRIKIDVSPDYSRKHLYPGVAERIHRLNPKAKIMYFVRNPIDRIVSHLHHDMFRDRITIKDIDRSLFENADYIKTSSYFYQIEDYLSFFGRPQVAVIQMERMKSDPAGFCGDVCSFLGLTDFKLPAKSYNLSEKRYLIRYHDAFHQYFPILGKLYHYFWYMVNIKIERPRLSGSQLVKLRNVLEPDAMRLRGEFGIDTSKWFG